MASSLDNIVFLIYNYVAMKALLNKKLLVIPAVISLGLIGVLVQPDEAKPAKSVDSTHINKPTVDVSNIPSTTTQEAQTQEVAVAEPSSPATTPPAESGPKTVDQLKAEAAAKIQSPEQATCFNQLIDYFYHWNISEELMLHRVDTIGQAYASYCAAWVHLNHYPPLGSGTPPVGFRD